MLGGYRRKIAVVDLSNQSVNYDSVSEEDLYKFVGGRGYGVRSLMNWHARGAPDSTIGMFVGPMTGTGIPLANRLTLVFRSPLTKTVAYANTGGYAGTALKLAGLDGVIATGQSKSPKYLFLKNEQVSIEDALGIWGKNALESVADLRAKHGDARVLSIGPAGENLVSFANVVNDAGRASGVRHGAGAVLGKMGLKAVVILADYSQKVQVADKLGFRDILKRLFDKLKISTLLNRENGEFSLQGTPLAVEPLNSSEALPVKNYNLTHFDGAKNLTSKKMTGTILVSRMTCNSCSVQCRRETATLKKYNFRTEGPDYAQISSLGSNCMVDDLEAVAYMNYLCYEVGLDPIETGNLLAIYAEATELGLTNNSEGGLRWGDADRMIEIIQMISKRSGVGKILADGAENLSKEFHKESLSTAFKGITIQNTDPRVEPAWGLLNATDNSGSSAHIWVYPDLIYSFKQILGINCLLPTDRSDFKSIAAAVKRKQDLVAVLDSLQICAFSNMVFDVQDYVSALNSVTGWQWSEQDLLSAGERIFNLERRFDNLVGVRDDLLPPKFKMPLEEGKNAGSVCHLDEMLESYYEQRGWKKGVVSEEKMMALGALIHGRQES